jgi:hypothetical protein
MTSLRGKTVGEVRAYLEAARNAMTEKDQRQLVKSAIQKLFPTLEYNLAFRKSQEYGQRLVLSTREYKGRPVAPEEVFVELNKLKMRWPMIINRNL